MPVAESVLGVNIAGAFSSEKGLGEGTRSLARSLRAVDIPFALNNLVSAGTQNQVEVPGSMSSQNPYPINVIHFNGDTVIHFARTMGHEYFEDRYNVGVWNWELSRMPDSWFAGFSVCDEIWVSSEFTRRAIAESSPVPVRRIPYSIEVPAQLPPGVDRGSFDLDAGRFVFLFVFDVQSVFQRKNPQAVVEAFVQAFGESTEVTLMIKASGGESDPASMAKLRGLCDPHSNIVLIDQVMTREMSFALMKVCDCYVSLHRAEGFGLTMAEAMAMGKPVIATGYSGNLDFMNEQNSFLVGYRLAALERSYGCYQAGNVWAQPDVAHAASLMRYVVDHPVQARAVGDQARADIQRDLCPSSVGSMIQSRLVEVINEYASEVENADRLDPLAQPSGMNLGVDHGAPGAAEAASSTSQSTDHMLGEALYFHSARDLGRAEALYGRLLQIDPGHADAIHFLGLLKHQTGRHDEGLEMMRRSIRINPSAPQYHTNLGNALIDRRLLEEAAACHQVAIRLAPEMPEPYCNMGNIMHQRNRPAEAIPYYRKAIALNPRFAAAHGNLGVVYKSEGRIVEAEQCFRTALEIDPGLHDACENLGNLLTARGDVKEAEIWYRAAMGHLASTENLQVRSKTA